MSDLEKDSDYSSSSDSGSDSGSDVHEDSDPRPLLGSSSSAASGSKHPPPKPPASSPSASSTAAVSPRSESRLAHYPTLLKTSVKSSRPAHATSPAADPDIRRKVPVFFLWSFPPPSRPSVVMALDVGFAGEAKGSLVSFESAVSDSLSIAFLSRWTSSVLVPNAMCAFSFRACPDRGLVGCHLGSCAC